MAWILHDILLRALKDFLCLVLPWGLEPVIFLAKYVSESLIWWFEACYLPVSCPPVYCLASAVSASVSLWVKLVFWWWPGFVFHSCPVSVSSVWCTFCLFYTGALPGPCHAPLNSGALLLSLSQVDLLLLSQQITCSSRAPADAVPMVHCHNIQSWTLIYCVASLESLLIQYIFVFGSGHHQSSSILQYHWHFTLFWLVGRI